MFEIILSLVVVGIVLIIAEMFLPGMVAGAVGGVALLGGVALSYSVYGTRTGNLAIVLLAGLGAVVFVLWLFIFPRSGFARRLTLTTTDKAPTDHPDHSDLVGMEGTAITQLRPAGIAMIDGRRVDVLAEDGFIEPNTRIRVLQTAGARVVVRKQSTPL